MFTQILEKYLLFVRPPAPTDSPRPELHFDVPGYLRVVGPERAGFLRDLSRTQHFAGLVDRTIRCAAENNDAAFFVQGVRLRESRGQKALEAEVQKIVGKLMHNYRNV